MDTLTDFLQKRNGSMRLGGVRVLENLRPWLYVRMTAFNIGDNISTDQVNHNGNYPYNNNFRLLR